MKKRLLITSIVMMLVVAVALSTATYAWFTSNASVTASSITMSAATSGSSALGIAWKAGTAGTGFNANYGTNIESYAYSGSLQPAAPNALGNAEPVFYTATIDSQGVFNADPVTHDVFRYANNANSGAEGYSNLIHIANLAQSGPVTVALAATITPHFVQISSSEATDTAHYDYYDTTKTLIQSPGENVSTGFKVEKNKDATTLVRIAVFEVSGATYTYKGCLASAAGENNTAVGSITNGSTIATSLMTGHNTTTTISLGEIDAQADKGYAIYVWLDGGHFDEAQSGKKADVKLTFSAN